ncbi:3-carboxy-cis,cis-muconate cycloisomerase [Phytohabitans rumicis]|uniref:3-carboxy-cis,cis-muconate cycloisomerase n=1 Tax=Phytohabitans rumicis TaxID=1076125 RepID=A0A6V8L4J9_9ACTN|nr:3-carboxy-cis,cis-muconate cycloisomerase [Phytohabitans rumicis]GFJ88997.1 3-carboxy-cis,cis-muconate cycloisomerase [Phytohabitans rumicis]
MARRDPPEAFPDHPGLFDGVLAAGPVRAAVGDGSWLRAMLDAEVALARASGAPPAVVEEIDSGCRTFAGSALSAGAAGAGNPVIPLVRELRAAVSPAAARYVHRGATSQDILDTAAMLVAREALGLILIDLSAAADAAADLAEAHRDTPLAARTLLQQALPTTFGLVAAGWLTALDEAAGRLAEVRDDRLAVQLGGAAGTLSALDLSTVERFAAELGLAEPVLPWHTDRTRIADLAGALGTAAGAVAKVARDVVLYAQTEVGELAEGKPGGSSTLPHKQNPVAAISAAACAAQAPGLVATLLATMAHEHQRAAGAWHAEWQPLTALLRSTGSAVHWLATCLPALRVDARRMRANLDATGGALLAERISGALAPKVGATEAHDLVRAAVASGRPLSEAFAAHFQPAELADLLDPASYLGHAGELTDRAVRRHRERKP